MALIRDQDFRAEGKYRKKMEFLKHAAFQDTHLYIVGDLVGLPPARAVRGIRSRGVPGAHFAVLRAIVQELLERFSRLQLFEGQPGGLCVHCLSEPGTGRNSRSPAEEVRAKSGPVSGLEHHSRDQAPAAGLNELRHSI